MCDWTVKTPVVVLLLCVGLCTCKLCLSDPPCYCRATADGTDISCRRVFEVSPVERLAANFSRVTLLTLDAPALERLPRKVFEGCSIAALHVTAPLAEISERAFTGIANLTVVRLDSTRLRSVPPAVALDSIDTLQMSRGVLSGLQRPLPSRLTSLLLTRNALSAVSRESFDGVASLRRLDLSRNRLSALDPDVFSLVSSLEDVNLAGNELASVDGCFQPLDPKIINLHGNNLTSLENVFHKNMWSMRTLDIGGNPFLNLTAASLEGTMPALTELNVGGSHLTSLDPDLLRPFPSLYRLFLDNNDLTRVPEGFFLHSRRLSTLVLSDNRLPAVDWDLPEGFHAIKHLALDGNELTRVRLGDPFRSVSFLDLSRNRIQSVDFQNMTAVTHLNMSDNPLDGLEPDCFEGLRKLHQLDLSSSSVTSLRELVRNLPALQQLFVSSSMLRVLGAGELVGLQKLKGVYLENNGLVSVEKAFANLPSLVELDISGNNLTTLTRDTFHEGELGLSKLWMGGNAWMCDCRLLWLLDWLHESHSHLADDPLCAGPFRGVPIRDLNRTDLSRWDCPPPCDCDCLQGKEFGSVVNCSRRGIRSLPQTFPENAVHIDLSGNGLTTFEGMDHSRYRQLKYLSVEDNQLTSFGGTALPISLQKLLLAGNNLRRIPFEELDNLTTTLAGNPWTCDCEAFSFSRWLRLNRNAVSDVDDVLCGDGAMAQQTIVGLSKDDVCSNLKLTNIAIWSGSALCLLLLCFLACCSTRFRSLLYTRCGCGCLKRGEGKDGEDFAFDAFLLFAPQDEHFALHVLAEALETKLGCRLFTPTREVFLRTSAAERSSSLADCQRVLVLLTRDFLDDPDCLRLLLESTSCSLQASSRRTVFVMRGDVSSRDISQTLAPLVKKGTCLRWGQCLFWDRLAFSLPKRTTGERGNGDNEPIL